MYTRKLCSGRAEKPHDAVVKFDMYQNLQQLCAVLNAITLALV